MPKVFVHVVLYNSLSQHGEASLLSMLNALVGQQGLEDSLKIVITDNGSSDDSFKFIKDNASENVTVRRLEKNLGFAGAHNLGAKEFIDSNFNYLLILNPDLRLAPDAIQKMVAALETHPNCGSACPKLLRADENLNEVTPRKLDATGMYLTKTLRHFDRGSECLDNGQYDKEEEVFGGSGACLMLRRETVLDVQVTSDDSVLNKVWPDITKDEEMRLPLFDEGFFAYREDADLAWRMQLYGWSCLYVPSAIGFHRRVVLPERRSILPAELNSHSVRNRFLLQLNNYSIGQSVSAFFLGVLFRNVLVIVGVLLKEHSSIVALKQVLMFSKRALFRRRVVLAEAKKRDTIEVMRKWL